MIDRGFEHRPKLQLLARWQQLASEMSIDKPGNHVNQSSQQKYPGRKEVVGSRFPSVEAQHERKRQIDQSWCSHRPGLAPMQAGIGKQNDDSTLPQNKEAASLYPV